MGLRLNLFWEKKQKHINEIWTVFKLINKLPNNYNFNTRCTAKRCNSYFFCKYWVTCWWVWTLSKFHGYFLVIVFQKISGPSSSGRKIGRIARNSTMFGQNVSFRCDLFLEIRKNDTHKKFSKNSKHFKTNRKIFEKFWKNSKNPRPI